jgi:hypothetical protein
MARKKSKTTIFTKEQKDFLKDVSIYNYCTEIKDDGTPISRIRQTQFNGNTIVRNEIEKEFNIPSIYELFDQMAKKIVQEEFFTTLETVDKSDANAIIRCMTVLNHRECRYLETPIVFYGYEVDVFVREGKSSDYFISNICGMPVLYDKDNCQMIQKVANDNIVANANNFTDFYVKIS